jgi:hypothetical protein
MLRPMFVRLHYPGFSQAALLLSAVGAFALALAAG